MKVKRLLSAFLAILMLCSLLTLPVGAAEDVPFADISDPELAEATGLLRSLGVVSGVGGNYYNPGGNFTRAEFCKMAIVATGRGGDAALQANRVIFPDVTAKHWALGYVNAAASGDQALVKGKGDGKFHPDAAITYGEAVTILMRALGYADADVATAGKWYAGYLAKGEAEGLTEGLSRTGEQTLTRGEAALLFRNLLFTEQKDSDALGIAAMGGVVLDPAALLSLKATSDDGTPNGVRTEAGVYKSLRSSFPDVTVGDLVRLVLDEKGRVAGILPSETGTTLELRLSTAEYSYLYGADGKRISVPVGTVLWKDGEQGTWSEEYLDLKPGTLLTLRYDVAGKLNYICVQENRDSTDTMVALSTGTGNLFAAITGSDSGFAIYKNGSAAGFSDLRRYDVGSYNAESKVLYVSDSRITGIYENAYPSTSGPDTITVLGHAFPVLESAWDDLKDFKLGDYMTLLLTVDNEVAGAVKTSVLRSNAVGVASVEGSRVKVTLTTGLVVEGEIGMSADRANEMQGRLVQVSASQAGKLNLSAVSGSGVTGSLDTAQWMLGNRKVTDGAHLFEQVGTSRLAPIQRDDITWDRVPASRISYVGLDYAGRVDTIVFNNVTGDLFDYGFLRTDVESGGSGNLSYSNRIAWVENKAGESSHIRAGVGGKDGDLVGLAASLEVHQGWAKLADSVVLTRVEGVKRTDFTDDSVVVNGQVFPLAANIDNHCYNKVAGNWFASLKDARGFSQELTVYYDRDPDEGGKVRFVIAE